MVESTQVGRSIDREYSAAIACRGLGAVVDTAWMTGWCEDRVSGRYKSNVLATGWFQPSLGDGDQSPSTHFLTSSHHSVRFSVASGLDSATSAQRDARRLIRVPSQSIRRPARASSSSLHANSISARSEKRRANDVCGTGVRATVRVVTKDGYSQSLQLSGEVVRGVDLLAGRGEYDWRM